MTYTVEVYKADKRIKKGERLVLKEDRQEQDLEALTFAVVKDYPASKGYRIQIQETYVTRTNIMTGLPFQERYDTPYFCSPSSESYWSM